MRQSRGVRSSGAGFTLVETIVAAAILAVSIVLLAYLMAMAVEQSSRTRRGAIALMAAQSKLDQLRALTWSVAADGSDVSDVATDTTFDPPRAAGGTGLSVSPPDTLLEDVLGYVDYVNEIGALQPSDEGRTAHYRRRWSISAIDPSDPHTLLLRVCVTRSNRLSGSTPEACLWTIRTRRR